MSADAPRDFIPVRIAVLTVSDTRDATQDRSGDVLVERIAAAGHGLAAGRLEDNDREVSS